MIGLKSAVELPARSFSAAALWHYVWFPTEPRSIQCEPSVQERKYAMDWTLAETRRDLGAFVFAYISPKVFYLSRTALRHAEDARRVGSGLRPSDLPVRHVRGRRNAPGPTRRLAQIPVFAATRTHRQQPRARSHAPSFKRESVGQRARGTPKRSRRYSAAICCANSKRTTHVYHCDDHPDVTAYRCAGHL